MLLLLQAVDVGSSSQQSPATANPTATSNSYQINQGELYGTVGTSIPRSVASCNVATPGLPTVFSLCMWRVSGGLNPPAPSTAHIPTLSLTRIALREHCAGCIAVAVRTFRSTLRAWKRCLVRYAWATLKRTDEESEAIMNIQYNTKRLHTHRRRAGLSVSPHSGLARSLEHVRLLAQVDVAQL